MEYREGTELLLGYVSGSVSTDASAELKRHVEACLACEKFVREQQAVWEALDAFEAEPVSAGFNRRLYQRMEEPVTLRERFSASWQLLRFWHGLPVAGAAAAALLVGGLIWQMPSTNRSATQQKPALTAKADVLQPDQLENALGDMEMLRDFNRVMRSDSPDAGKM
jgi:anti-sigma factor RsiW